MTSGSYKQVSTSKLGTFSKKLLKIEFIRRNKKGLLVFLSIWVIANVGAYFIYRTAVIRANDAFFQQGVSAAQNLATKSESPILDKDILALHMVIKELKNVSALKFAAILDHNNMILTHTDTEMINKKFDMLDQQKTINTSKDIKILTGMAPDGSEIFRFLNNMVFADVEIGKVYVALSAIPLHSTLDRLKYIYISRAYWPLSH